MSIPKSWIENHLYIDIGLPGGNTANTKWSVNQESQLESRVVELKIIPAHFMTNPFTLAFNDPYQYQQIGDNIFIHLATSVTTLQLNPAHIPGVQAEEAYLVDFKIRGFYQLPYRYCNNCGPNH